MRTSIHRHHSVLCHLHCTTILYFGCCYYIHKLDATTTLRITMLTCKCIRFVVNVFNSLYKNKSTSWMQFPVYMHVVHLVVVGDFSLTSAISVRRRRFVEVWQQPDFVKISSTKCSWCRSRTGGLNGLLNRILVVEL